MYVYSPFPQWKMAKGKKPKHVKPNKDIGKHKTE